MTDFADVLDNFRAKGNLENRSLQTIMCFLFPKSKVTNRQNLLPFLGLDQRLVGVFRGLCAFLMA